MKNHAPNKSIATIILAAGRGTRMKSNMTKVLHQLGGKCLLQHVIDAALPLTQSISVVVGHNSESVKNAINNNDINWVFQKNQLGTGHAVKESIPSIADNSICLILYGDVPLIQTNTLNTLIQKAETTGFSILTVIQKNPSGYGRIIRNSSQTIQSIIEHKDATAKELEIDEIHSGIMAVRGLLLKKYLNKLKPNNSQGELYLTNIVEKAVKDDVNISSFVCENSS